VVSFPPPDRWVPLPASRPAVLGRRWTPAASTPSAAPRDCWTSAQRNRLPVPILERHWACATTFPTQTAPIRTGSHPEETVTLPGKTTPPPADCPMLPDKAHPPLPATVTLTSLDSPPQTVTRLCVGCGKPLEGKRPQAKAHGAACRQRAYRRRKKEATQAQRQRGNGSRSELEPTSLTPTTVGSAPG
jgi:hypothetical protein